MEGLDTRPRGLEMHVVGKLASRKSHRGILLDWRNDVAISRIAHPPYIVSALKGSAELRRLPGGRVITLRRLQTIGTEG